MQCSAAGTFGNLHEDVLLQQCIIYRIRLGKVCKEQLCAQN